MSITIASVNVNGIRAAMRKGMDSWLVSSGVDIVLAQEVRAPDDITAELFGPDWYVANYSSVLKGRAGVAVAIRCESGLSATQVRTDAITDEVDADSGRWIEVDIAGAQSDITVVSAYLHSGELGTEKQDFKYSHLDRVTERLAELAAEKERVLVAGDFNIVHTERDIKNWKPNHNKRAGVLDEEIAYLDTWMEGDTWVDVARKLNGDVQGPYTWWSWRGKAFDNDAGWRIDYQMATSTMAEKALSTRVDRANAYDKRFSDHAPLIVEYDI